MVRKDERGRIHVRQSVAFCMRVTVLLCPSAWPYVAAAGSRILARQYSCSLHLPSAVTVANGSMEHLDPLSVTTLDS